MSTGKYKIGDFKITNSPQTNREGNETDKSTLLFPVDEYDCSLSEELSTTAHEQLREDVLLRKQGLEIMRHFIKKQQHIIKCRMDSNFLLRFLRTKKFCFPVAEQSLDKYVSVRCAFPEIMQNLDPDDPAIERLINKGSAFPLLKRDNNGHTIILCKQGVIDPHIDKTEDVIRYWILILETLLDDEANQINGFMFICDCEGNSLAHTAMWGIPTLKKLVLCWEKAMPMRNKGLYSVNVPSVFVTLIDLFKKLVSDKIANRILVYRNMAELFNVIPQDIFPKEYGGEIPEQKMIDEWKALLKTKKKKLLALDEAFLVDENQRLRDKDPYGIEELKGSFRKLEID